MSIDQNFYKNKYLKYKNKYLQLKQLGGANCAQFGFNQHMGECWHDTLSMIFCYCDDIGESIQEIFKSEESFAQFINTIDIDEKNGIPLDFLPVNFDLYNEGDKIKLLELSKQYFNSLYDRYTNEQKIDLKPSIIKKLKELTPEDKEKINKYIVEKNIFSTTQQLEVFNKFFNNDPEYNDMHMHYEWFINNMVGLLRDTKLLYTYRSGIFRANSVDQSLQCVDTIYAISNHNSSDKLNFLLSHAGRLSEFITTMNIISYFILNYKQINSNPQQNVLKRTLSVQPNPSNPQLKRELSLPEIIELPTQDLVDRKLKFLSSKSFDYNLIMKYSLKTIIEKLKEMKKDLEDALCIILNSYTSIEDKDTSTKEKDMYKIGANHVQCFFICEKKLYFYDDNGIKIDGIKKVVVNFDWKTYLNKIIDDIIKTITEDNKEKIYDKFSQFYYNTLKYPTTHISLLKSFMIIKNQDYTKETFYTNLFYNLKFQLYLYENVNIKILIRNNNIDTKLLFELLYYSILTLNYIITEELLKKDNIFDCITIKSDEGYTLLHKAISLYTLKNIKLLLKVSKIHNSFIIKDNNGNTPLTLALKNKDDDDDKIKIITELLSHYRISDSFNIKDNNGKTPIDLARSLNLDEKLFANKYNESNICETLFQAVEQNNFDFVEELLTKPNISKCFAITQDNKSLLHITLTQSSIQIITLLLSIPGIEQCFTIKNNYGNTPLLMAIDDGYYDKAKIFLSNPKIVNCLTIKNNDGNTVLHLVISKEIEILKILLSIPGIEQCFTIQNNDGDTPLHKALSSRRTIQKDLDELLKHPKISTSYNIKNNENKTPIELALKRNLTLI